MYAEMNVTKVFEQIVEPVAKAAKQDKLGEKERDNFKESKNKNKSRGKPPGKELLLEPFVGLLFDFNA